MSKTVIKNGRSLARNESIYCAFRQNNEDATQSETNVLRNLDTQQSQTNGAGLKPVQEEGNPILQNQVSYASCVRNGIAPLKSDQHTGKHDSAVRKKPNSGF